MEYFGLTDKGRVRPTNQDIFQIEAREDNQTALLVVCDGMGGANAGNVASRFAAQSFIESAGDALSGTLDETARQNLLTQALKQANETVFSLAGRQPEFRGMGTTLVAALIQGDCATVINVGDSRAYRFDGEAMHQISEDHSYVEEMRRRGKITEADARTHPQKILITRAVGVEPCVEGDLFEVRLNEKDMLLLCSDGLTGMAEDSRIAEVLAKYGSEHNDVHITMISDNITNLYEKLKTYELDFAIVEGRLPAEGFNTLLLDTDSLVLVVANTNRLAKKTMVTVNELKKEKLILRLPDSGTRNLFLSHLESNNMSLRDFNVILEVDNIATIKDLIRRGFGVSILAKSACLDELKKGKITVLPVENLSMTREINIVYHSTFGYMDILQGIIRLYNETVRMYRS